MTILSHIDGKIRPRLSVGSVSPETFTKLYSFARPIAIALEKYMGPKIMIETGEPVELFKNSLVFRNRLGNAAGQDKEGELLAFNYMMGAGFAVVGTVLDQPHPGNLIHAFGRDVNPWVPLPHSGSAINSLGLPSKGVGAAIANIYAFRKKYNPKNFPIGMSVMGHPALEGIRKDESLLRCIEQARAYVDFFEINESCPNVSHEHGSDADLLRRLQMAVSIAQRGRTYTPVLVKLGDIGDPAHTVDILTQAGVDGIVAINTQKNYAELAKGIDPSEKKLFDYYTQTHQGGVSGRVIKTHAFHKADTLAYEIMRQGSHLQLVHVGGIEDRVDMEWSAGIAPLSEWYTGLMTAMTQLPTKEVYRSMVG
ncbi:hypothetical protein GOV07_02485 [Candidatus Woesearchaeota archaeon]|nr:hypothetical protein [Candidatus Woesearchaeota archaeon]